MNVERLSAYVAKIRNAILVENSLSYSFEPDGGSWRIATEMEFNSYDSELKVSTLWHLRRK